MMLLCLAVALHDVDGPVRCATGERIRLEGIGATELDGSCRPNQPCVPGDPFDQRRRMAAAIGAEIASDSRQPEGSLWFVRAVPLHCRTRGNDPDAGRSYGRLVARCRTAAGVDLSCLAIRLGVALRWARYDPAGRLRQCAVRRG